jgi:hypothetical protein
VYRRLLVVALLLLSGLQGSTALAYADTVGPSHGATATLPSPCAAHAAASSPSDHSACCPQHTTQPGSASCLAHCAAMIALVSSFPMLSLATLRPVPSRDHSLPFISERPAPGLRPPIAQRPN